MNKRKRNKAFYHAKAFWGFVLPSILLFSIFFLIPLCLSIYFSFTNYDGWKTLDFTGIVNYTRLFTDKEFYRVMGRTFKYTLITLPFRVIIPLLIATLVSSKLLKAKSMIRTLIYIPVLLSPIVVGITINWMFGQEYGLINFIIQSMGGKPLAWALNPNLATSVISIATVWASIGFNMIIFIGGISNISNELYEAANVDGASKIRTFFSITLPLLSPTTFLVVLLSTVNLLKEYALVQGITLGGPGSATKYIVQYIYDKGFNQFQYGYASAIGTIASLVFIIIALVQFKFSNNGGEV